MDLNATPPPSPEAATCSVCLDPVVAGAGARSVAALQCGHEFHLDCIGSAFNAKGAMQCPNCRRIEKGCWLYADGCRPSTDSDSGNGVTTETYDLGPRARADFLVEDHSNSGHMLLYLDPIDMEGHDATHATVDLSNDQVFDAAEPRNYGIEHHYLGDLPMLGIFSYPIASFGIGVPRYDGSNQQSSRQYMHSHNLHQPTPRSGSSSAAPLGSSSAVISEARGHGHGMRGNVFQQTVPPSTPSSPYPPTARRVQPRALSIASFIAASYTSEVREPHGISLTGAANAQNSNLPNGDDASRHADRPYPYTLGHDTLWRPSEGWGQAYGSVPSRTAMFHSENGYQPLPPDGIHPFL